MTPEDFLKVKAIMERVDQTYQTVKMGYADLTGPDRSRRMTGLRNFIVFGRSLTFVLQNLRSVVPVQFEPWYAAETESMKNDPVMRYFVEARNELEKQGKLSINTLTSLNSFTVDSDMRQFGPQPEGAVSFFIGDQLGGAGWQVIQPDGTFEKYYVQLPQGVTVTQAFSNFPESKAPQLAGKTLDEICKLYFEKLGNLVKRAETTFLDRSGLEKKARLHKGTHLRLVK